jgi:hypothetical protein
MIASFYLEGRCGFIKPYNPSRFIEVHVPSQESVQLSICVIEVLILHEFFCVLFSKKKYDFLLELLFGRVICFYFYFMIYQVKVEMLKNGSTVAYTRFTNIPTDNKMTWFNHDNLLDSSWNDLIHSSANKFTMDDGYVNILNDL